MPKRKTKTTPQSRKQRQSTTNVETDGLFLLKLTLYVVIGSLWLKLSRGQTESTMQVPVGLVVGLLATTHEHFKIDRKIEYAVLVVAALFGFMAPYGLFVNL